MRDFGSFGLEEPRRASLLVASISERVNRGSQAPAFKLSLPGLSPRSPSENTPRTPGTTPRKHRGPTPADLGHAGAEVVRFAAVMGGVLLAGISKAAHHLTQHAKRPVELPFYQSFSFPWAHRGKVTQR